MENTAEILSTPLIDGPAVNNPFQADDGYWETMYQRVKNEIKNGHLHSNVTEHDALADWLNRQIQGRRHLSASQFKKLDYLGIDWDMPISRDHAWQVMYTRLQAFRQEFNHCRVPDHWSKDTQLALWVMRQRKLNKQGKILEYRKHLLNGIGFTWEVQEEYNKRWDNLYQQLAAFCKEHGHCLVPGKEKQLVGWIERQRLARKKNKLSPEREKRLNAINFVWEYDEIKTRSWEENYQQLCQFYDVHGHSFVPGKYKENKSLGSWVALQRQAKRKNRLSALKIEKLNKLEFVWSGEALNRLQLEYDSQWEESFEKLQAYKKTHGTCQVSLKIDPALQGWTVWQRRMFYLGKMHDDRVKKLNEISFPWSVNEGYWSTMFNRLSVFYQEFGHTQVPAQWKKDPRLAAWVYRIRANRSSLSDEKVELLNAIGFDWTIIKKNPVEWNSMYQRLVKFKETHGHVRVLVRWPEDKKLGKWVSRMRNEKPKLNPERLNLLDAIGFDWKSPSKGK